MSCGRRLSPLVARARECGGLGHTAIPDLWGAPQAAMGGGDVVAGSVVGGLLAVNALVAVDVRPLLEPPLPGDFVGLGSKAGLVPCAVELEPCGASLWDAARDAQAALTAAALLGGAECTRGRGAHGRGRRAQRRTDAR